MAEPGSSGGPSGSSNIDLSALARQMESVGAELQQNIISNLAVEIPADLHMPPALSGMRFLTGVFPPPSHQVTDAHVIEHVKGLLAQKVVIAGNAREDDVALQSYKTEFFIASAPSDRIRLYKFKDVVMGTVVDKALQPGPRSWVHAFLHWKQTARDAQRTQAVRAPPGPNVQRIPVGPNVRLAPADTDVRLTPQDILSIAVFNMTSLQFIDCTVTEDPFLVTNLSGDQPLETYMVRTAGRETAPTIQDISLQIITQHRANNRPQLKLACLRWDGEAALGEVRYAEPIMLHTSLRVLELVGFSWVARYGNRGFSTIGSLVWTQANPSITKLVLSGCLVNDVGLEQAFDSLPNLKDLSIELACRNRMRALIDPLTGRYTVASSRRDLGTVLRLKGRGLRSLDLDATAYPFRHEENRDDFFGLLIGLENLEQLTISRADFFKEDRVEIDLMQDLALTRMRRLRSLYIRHLRSDAEVNAPASQDPSPMLRLERAQIMMNACVNLLPAMPGLSVTLELPPGVPEPSIPGYLTRRIQWLEKYRACHGAIEGSQFASNPLDPSQVITISRPRQGE
ncbi:unnamed protein product [Clonostachys rhizophaga]|uniref:Uncharacterized protein n=1 Tax=Clonostachys rhizophaga TaxID=160324 RepID=A0A9N9VW29_9HYPO|nr:unnamed protein product [Clonostachys rhizophaga]